MKYLIVNASGKQHLVKHDRWEDLDCLRNARIGDILSLQKILFYRKPTKVQFGKPFLKDGFLTCEILAFFQNKKLRIVKTKPKKHYTRTQGFRKIKTRVQFNLQNNN